MATYKFKSEEYSDIKKNPIELSESSTTTETFTISSLEKSIIQIDEHIEKLKTKKVNLETKISDAKTALGI